MAGNGSSHYVGTTDSRSTPLGVATSRQITKYLATYGEPEALQLDLPPHPKKHVLVIPAYQESIDAIEAVFDHLQDLVVILVVNSPDASDLSTQQLLKDIKANWQAEAQGYWRSPGNNLVCVVDRVNHPINKRQGVGHARKIGADIALRFIQERLVEYPWIYSTDADAILPQDYFAQPTEHELAFTLFRFQHESANDTAAALYEFSLLWYALGLHWAGSPYGYPTVGSTIAFQAEHYAKVRGFPKRSAGEDFYLLNKLRKLGDYEYQSATIRLSNRRSDRVPFGTGPGLKKIDNLIDPNEMTFYHPHCFAELKDFLLKLRSSQEAANLTDHFSKNVIAEFVSDQELLPLLSRQQGQKPEVYLKFVEDWFDGFRTLKFIHHCRNHFPSVAYSDLWNGEILKVACPESVQAGTELLWQRLLAGRCYTSQGLKRR